MIKILKKLGIDELCLYMIKTTWDTFVPKVLQNGENWEHSYKIRNETDFPTITNLIQWSDENIYCNKASKIDVI
jgi:hypothetical protein